MEGASHEILLQRFKLLHLVQQVAKADVEEVIRTVGVDALAYSGRGVSDALAAIGLSTQDPRDAASRRRDPYIDRREYDRHIFRDISKPRQPSGSHPQAVGQIGALQEPPDSSLRFRVRNLQEPRVPFSRTQQLMQSREAHQGQTSAAPLPRQQQERHQRFDELPRRGDLVSTPEKERAAAAAAGRISHAQGTSPAPPPASSSVGGGGQSIPEAVVYLAAQILAKGGGGAGGGRYSKESTPRKQGAHAARAGADADVPAQSAAVAGEAFDAQYHAAEHSESSGGPVVERRSGTRTEQHAAKSDNVPDRVRTVTLIETSTSPLQPIPSVDATQRCDECFGTEDRSGFSTENAAVEATVSYATAETMTPSKKMKATTTQTSNAAATKTRDQSEKGSRPSAVTPPKPTERRKSSTAAAPPTLNLTYEQDHHHRHHHHRRDSHNTTSGIDAPPRSHTPPSSDDAGGALPSSSALDALASIERILSEQYRIEQRSATLRQSLSSRQVVGGTGDHLAGEEHPGGTAPLDVDAVKREMELARAARSVDSMLQHERTMEEATLEKAQRLEENCPQRPESAPRRERRKMPRSVVERLLQFRKDEIACVKYNEQLWNTSSLSQHVFADRLSAALLDDLLSEVVAEVSSVLDDYVEGLAEHELQ